MCLPSSRNIIEQVIQGWVNQDLMFTGYEVYLETQRRALATGQQQEEYFHLRNAIRQEVQTYLDSGAYRKSLRDVGAPTPAFVYYPDGANPANYVPLDRNTMSRAGVNTSTSSPVQGVVAQATSTAPARNGLNTTAGRLADARGTVCVPSLMVRDMGFSVRDTAYVYKRADGELVLRKSMPSGVAPETTYTVDENFNVRITSATLDAGGLSTGPNASYDFVSEPAEIVIRNSRP